MAEGRVDLRSMRVEPPFSIVVALERGDVARFNQWLAEERAKPENNGVNIGALIDGFEPRPGVDLSGVDFSHAYISRMELNGARFEHANFDNAVLSGSWDHVNATGATFRNAQLDMDIADSSFDGADFTHAQLGGADLLQNSITRSSFRNARFNYTLFHGVENITGSYFNDASIDNSVFRSTRFVSTDFTGATFGQHVIFDLPHAYFDATTLASNPLLDQRFSEYHEVLQTAEVVPELPAGNIDFAGVLDALYANNRGVALGETHYQLAHQEFLRHHMQDLADRNVGVIFFEGFPPGDHAEAIFERFNNNVAGADQEMFTLVHTLRGDLNPSFHESVFASMRDARAAGIRVEPLDDRDAAGTTYDYIRLRDSNSEWARIVTERLAELEHEELITPETRYLVYGGGGHTRSTVIERGADAYLGIPSIDMYLTRGEMRIEAQRGTARINADVIAHLPVSSAQDTGYSIMADGGFYSPSRIAILQDDLRALGYEVPVTAAYDAATIEAVRRFQEQNRLPATGNADERTLEGLNVAALEAYLNRLNYAATPPSGTPDIVLDEYTLAGLRAYYGGRIPTDDITPTVSHRVLESVRDSIDRLGELDDALTSIIGPSPELPTYSFTPFNPGNEPETGTGQSR